jgi:hypothetical protein
VAASALLLSLLATAVDGRAQCGAKASSCSACHDGARAPSPRDDPWHKNHAFADLCPTCHGGQGDVRALAGAHAGLADPLDPSGDRCASCHGADAAARLERYRSARTAGADGGSGEATVTGDHSPPPGRTRRAHGEPGPNLAMGVVVAAVGALEAIFVTRRERARARRGSPPPAGPPPPSPSR